MGVHHTVLSTFVYIWKFPLNKQTKENKSPRRISSWLRDSRGRDAPVCILHHSFKQWLSALVTTVCTTREMLPWPALSSVWLWFFWILRAMAEVIHRHQTWQGWMNSTTTFCWPHWLLEHMPPFLTPYHLKKRRAVLAAFPLRASVFNSLRREQVREKAQELQKLQIYFLVMGTINSG